MLKECTAGWMAPFFFTLATICVTVRSMLSHGRLLPSWFLKL